MEICEHCGAKIMKYWHKLNKPLCSALIRAFQAKGFKEFSLREINLSHEQKCNFQKLKYWNLINKSPKGWIITKEGENFVLGLHAVQDRIQTFRDNPVDASDDFVHIHDVVEGYQWRKDYLDGA